MIQEKNIDQKDRIINIQYFGNYTIKFKLIQMLRSIEELIRIINTTEGDQKYLNMKYPNHASLIDYKVRVLSSKGTMTISMIKYSHRSNYHATREKIINYGLASEECP